MGKYQARIAADTILGHDGELRSDGARSPRVTFTDPRSRPSATRSRRPRRPASTSGTSTSRRRQRRRLLLRPRAAGHLAAPRRPGAAGHRRRHDHRRRGRRVAARGDDRDRRRGAARRPLARRPVVPDAQRDLAEAARGLRPVSGHQLAQINVARLLAPIEAPQTADFVGSPRAGQRACRSCGRVHLEAADGGGNVTCDPGLRRPTRDREPLRLGVDRGARGFRLPTRAPHRAVLRRRREWFERHLVAATALWWIPAWDDADGGRGTRRGSSMDSTHGPTQHQPSPFASASALRSGTAPFVRRRELPGV